MDDFAVVVSAGTLRSTSSGAVGLPHRWTVEGLHAEVSGGGDVTGAHLLHLAVVVCVLNDVYREAARLKVPLSGVRVSAAGGFDAGTWRSTGIGYSVELDSAAAPDRQSVLLETVDAVAEIPRAVRAGTSVVRVAAGDRRS